MYVCMYACMHACIRNQYVHESSTNFYSTLISRISITFSGHVPYHDLRHLWPIARTFGEVNIENRLTLGLA